MKKYFAIAILALLPIISWAQCITFHNLPYATAERYQEAEMVQGWDRTADYSQRGPAMTQTGVTNDMYYVCEGPQSENALVLTINTPSMEGSVPVAVYIHGGSHHHGSGEWELYDPAGLTEEQGIVTVNISFRHGVIGYLYDEKNGNSDLGARDIITAMKWIKANIADFGGDPDMVTVFGQSSGAQSVVYLLAGADEKLFKRAMVFSAPFGITLKEKKAIEHAKRFDGCLAEVGLTRETATAEQLIEAEERYKDLYGGTMAFAPCGYKQMPKKLNCGVEDVVVTYQKSDAAMYVQSFKKKTLEEYGTGGDHFLEKIATSYVFKKGAKKYAHYLKKQGVNSQCFEFTYYPENANWRAAHGMEMGLLYGPESCYIGYNLMGTLTIEELAELRHSFRKTVADFVRTGTWESEFGRSR